MTAGGNRFPGYDVMAKQYTQSFNEKTREVLYRRLSIEDRPAYLNADEFAILLAVASRIVPQSAPHVPLAGMVDQLLATDGGEGYRKSKMPPLQTAWRQGLAAIEAEAQKRYRRGFCTLDPASQDVLLKQIEQGDTKSRKWKKLPPREFFKNHVVKDIVSTYYSHPAAWNEMGFGGPASPRGYVRMQANRRDPWEAAENHGNPGKALQENLRVGR